MGSMKAVFALSASALIGACTMVPPPNSTPPQPQGYAVPFDVPVRVGDLVVTPKKLVEDSRCPMNARCVWAGRVVVTARIVGPGFSDTADLTLGRSYSTTQRRLDTLALVNAANAADIFAVDDVDGALVGGASLTADKFLPIVEAVAG